MMTKNNAKVTTSEPGITPFPFGERPDSTDPFPFTEVESVPRPLVVRALELPVGHSIGRHRHGRHQLVYARRGVMTVVTDIGIWVVPPQRAVWMPALIDHVVMAREPVSMRNVYLSPGVFENLPRECCVVTVSPLLRELIRHACTLPRLYDENGVEGRLMAVIADQISAMPVAPLKLPMPTHPRLIPIVEGLRSDHGDNRSLTAWAREAGASSRTLARLFQSETGMTFGQWRQQARLLEALVRLARREPVSTIALDLGYGSQSAFIAMFRKALGKTPARYFSD